MYEYPYRVWSAAPHYIQALDNRTEQNANLNLVVSPTSVPEATSKKLALSLQRLQVLLGILRY
jgi:hypothetical protein